MTEERSTRHLVTGFDSDGPPEDPGEAPGDCPFCRIAGRELVAENELAIAFRDGFPVSPGHTLLTTRRHVVTWFEATREEQVAILDLADRVKTQLEDQGIEVPGPDEGPHSNNSAAWDAVPGTRLVPDGYNLGANCGPAAGQTVMHLHLHLIPRYLGDHDDPRGGVRWIFPKKARYWGD